MNLIEQGLYIGAYPEKVDDWDAVFCLTTKPPPALPGMKACVWLPIIDGPFPGIPWLTNAVALLHALHQQYRVLVHCRFGISRSVMLTAAYLMWKNGFDMEIAMEWVRTRRDVPVLPNPSFVAGLREYEEYLNAERTGQAMD